MAARHVNSFDSNRGKPANEPWEDLVAWDGDLYDPLFQGDVSFATSWDELHIPESVASDLSSAPPSVGEASFYDYPLSPLSFSSSITSGTAFATSSPLDFQNDKVHTNSFGHSNPLAFQPQALDSLGGWVDQSTNEELEHARAIPIPRSHPRSIASSFVSSSPLRPRIIEPAPESDTSRGIRIPSRGPRSRASSLNSPSAPSYGWVQYQVNNSNNRLVPLGSGSNGSRRQRGRTKGLNPDQRKSAALMRVVKACSNCKRRKEKCDPGIPCKSCIEHYKGNLVNHPCRDRSLADLSTVFLSERLGWHPTARSLECFLLPSNFTISDYTLVVPISLGFGPTFDHTVRIVHSNDPNRLLHQHVVYDWPPGSTSGTHRCNAILPAILSDTSTLSQVLDQQLSLLVTSYFKAFPLYCSPLRVLRDIYILYRSLPSSSNRVLHQALKLLVLVHIGGDTSVSASDPTVVSIMAAANLPDTTPTPCFIRAQLGAVMPALAQELMRDVLSQLERLALSRRCADWPLILATSVVLLMSIESIQYHAAKMPYHSSFDTNPTPLHERTKCQDMDEQGIKALLNFYTACYGGCHARLREDWNGEGSDAHNMKPEDRFVNSMRAAIRNSNSGGYLKDKEKVGLEKVTDMNCFFDRLLAKLLLLRT